VDDAQRLSVLADHAAGLVEDGMVIGLGSGSTAEAFVKSLGVRVASGLAITGVPTSKRTEKVAREVGVPLTTLSDAPRLDLGIDGADEIDPELNLTKGRGGALLYEKIVALACERWMIVAAAEKLVGQLGTRIRLPVEIIPFGWEQTAGRIASLGLDPQLRIDQDGAPFLTDGRHYVLDCATGPIESPSKLARDLKLLAGVVDHGLFVGISTAALVSEADGTVRTVTASADPKDLHQFDNW
jgi:ribose 5-phosphate isomerase A